LFLFFFFFFFAGYFFILFLTGQKDKTGTHTRHRKKKGVKWKKGKQTKPLKN